MADTSNALPQMKQQYEAAERGRGLFLVTMLAEQWSYYPVATGGKVVWAELVVPKNEEQDDTEAEAADDASQRSERLPEREPGASGHVAAHAAALADVALLERVLWGLQRLEGGRCGAFTREIG